MTRTFLTREQSRRADQLAIERFGMNGLVLMENAGRGCADLMCRLGIDGQVAVLCGKGNNGGDGYVIARHLNLRGHSVRIIAFSSPAELRGDAAANYAVLARTAVPVVDASQGGMLASELSAATWIVDALLGTGARGEPRPPFDDAIEKINNASARRIAVDLPSGLDCQTGIPAQHTVRADHTCTFLAPKVGFQAAEAQEYLGVVHVADIGTPPEVLAAVLAGE